jgi:hypothetical protein
MLTQRRLACQGLVSKSWHTSDQALVELNLNIIKILDLLLAINTAIKDQGLSEHIRLLRLWKTPTGAISRILKERASVNMLNSAKTAILEAI